MRLSPYVDSATPLAFLMNSTAQKEELGLEQYIAVLDVQGRVLSTHPAFNGLPLGKDYISFLYDQLGDTPQGRSVIHAAKQVLRHRQESAEAIYWPPSDNGGPWKFQITSVKGQLHFAVAHFVPSSESLDLPAFHMNGLPAEAGDYFRTLAECAPMMVWLAGTNQLRTYLNKGWMDFTGHARDQDAGANWLRYVHNDDLGSFLKAYETAFDKRESFHLEYRLRRHDGEFRWIMDSGAPRFDQDGHFLGYVGSCLDVTERMHAEQALRRKEEFFRQLVEHAPDIIRVLDLEGRVIYDSPSVQRILGYAPEERIGSNCFERIHPDERPSIFERFKAAVASGGLAGPIEYRYQAKNGSWLSMEAVGQRTKDEHGQDVMVLNVRNITDRRQVEDNLRESEERFRSVAETASEAIVIIDEKQLIVFVNSAVEGIFGYPPHELIGQSIFELMPDDVRILHRIALENYLTSGTRTRPWTGIEARGRKKDGKTLHLAFSLSEFRQAGQRYFAAIIHDITERKHVELALRESEERYRKFFQLTGVGAIQAQPGNGKLLRVNQAFCRITGFSEEELLTHGFREITHPEDRERHVDLFSQLANGQRTEIRLEQRCICKDGTTRWVHVDASLLRDVNGQAIHSVALIQDITERKQAQQALMESEELFRELIVDLQVGVMVHAPNGAIVLCNHSAERLLGRSEEQLIGRTCCNPATWDVIQENGQPFKEEELPVARAVATGQPALAVMMGVMRPGTTERVWLFVDAVPHFGNAGNLARVICTCTDITERKKAIDALAASQQRNHAILRAMPDMMFLFSRDGIYLDFYAKHPDQLLMHPENFLGKHLREVIPIGLADQFLQCFERMEETDETQVLEYGLLVQGRVRSYESRMVRTENQILSIVRDITDRKASETALKRSHAEIRLLAGRLISAQEEERKRIALDLHDDINQKLAALSIAVSGVQRALAKTGTADVDKVANIATGLADLSSEIRGLSHELHPAILEHAGLLVAIRAHASEFQARTNIDIILHLPETFDVTSKMKLCLYRVTQEALNNCAKHSGAKRVTITLRELASKAQLCIEDDGVGFDTNRAHEKSGIGLIGIEERVRLLGGTVEVHSIIDGGTQVLVELPIASPA